MRDYKDLTERIKRRRKVKERAAQRSLRQRTPLVLVSGPQQYQPNPCGPCTACCTLVGVQNLDPPKPPWTKCEHQAPTSQGICEQGCSIYDNRPEECRNYYCLYQGGILKGGEEMRPDNFGILCEIRGPDDLIVLMMWEVWPDAEKQQKVQQFIEKLKAHNRPIVVRKHNSMTKFSLYCTESQRYRVVAWLRSEMSLIEEKEHGG